MHWQILRCTSSRKVKVASVLPNFVLIWHISVVVATTLLKWDARALSCLWLLLLYLDTWSRKCARGETTALHSEGARRVPDRRHFVLIEGSHGWAAVCHLWDFRLHPLSRSVASCRWYRTMGGCWRRSRIFFATSLFLGGVFITLISLLAWVSNLGCRQA